MTKRLTNFSIKNREKYLSKVKLCKNAKYANKKKKIKKIKMEVIIEHCFRFDDLEDRSEWQAKQIKIN